jgi:hypothetical protein
MSRSGTTAPTAAMKRRTVGPFRNIERLLEHFAGPRPPRRNPTQAEIEAAAKRALSAERVAQRAAHRKRHEEGIPLPPIGWDSEPNELYLYALMFAARKGWLKVPPVPGEGRSRVGVWKGGKPGIELLRAVDWEIVKAQDFDEARVRKLRAMPFRERQIAMRKLAKRNLSISAALKKLQDQDPKKWGRYDLNDLRKRYDEARKFWD